jgi:hypothetical protein
MAFEADEVHDPNAIKSMASEERAMWLGKWFALHYAAWVSEFHMKELETYQRGPGGDMRDMVTTPLPSLLHTFERFRIPEEEWRSPLFCSPVQFFPDQVNIPDTSKFREGLRRFRNEVISTIHTHAIRIFGITDVMTIDHRERSNQVAALHPLDKFLYQHGDVDDLEQFMRSDCVIRASHYSFELIKC